MLINDSSLGGQLRNGTLRKDILNLKNLRRTVSSTNSSKITLFIYGYEKNTIAVDSLLF